MISTYEIYWYMRRILCARKTRINKFHFSYFNAYFATHITELWNIPNVSHSKFIEYSFIFKLKISELVYKWMCAMRVISRRNVGCYVFNDAWQRSHLVKYKISAMRNRSRLRSFIRESNLMPWFYWNYGIFRLQ